MAHFTGQQLMSAVMERFVHVSLAPIVKNALGSRLSQQIESGSDSPFALMATLINTTPVFSQLRDQLGGNTHFRQALQEIIDELSIPLRQFDRVINVETDTTYNAQALGDVRFNFVISGRDAEVTVIQNFSVGDAISVANWDGTGEFDRGSGGESNQLVFGFGDIVDFQGAWVVTFTGVDEALVNAVLALDGQLTQQIDTLADHWGQWFLEALPDHGDPTDERHFDQVIKVIDDTIYNAEEGDVHFNFTLSERDAELTIIQNFSAGDAISITNWDGTGEFSRGSGGSDQLVFGFGDLVDFQGVWVVTFTGVDEALVDAVLALDGQLNQQIDTLTGHWGQWFLEALPDDGDPTVRQFDQVIEVAGESTYDAAERDVRFNFELPEYDIEFATIHNFSAGDALSIADWDGAGFITGGTGTDQLVVFFGDILNFLGVWVVELTGVDEGLVNEVLALGDQFDDQIALLTHTWGEWLI